MTANNGTMNMSPTDAGAPLMNAASMAMVFFQSATTPLYSSAWTPSSFGPYAGTCLFLVFLAVVHRVLIALRNVLFHAAPSLRGKPLSSHHADLESSLYQDEKETLTSTWRRIRRVFRAQPISLGTETARASIEVVIGGVGYLLYVNTLSPLCRPSRPLIRRLSRMLAVMTMNLGYFLSVLGGMFLGVFLAGRFAADEGDSCH